MLGSRMFAGVRTLGFTACAGPVFDAVEREYIPPTLTDCRETIREDVLKPLEMSVNQLAKALKVDTARLNEIVRGAPRNHRRHSPAAFPLSGNLGRILDWTPGRLRFACCSPGEAEED